MPRASNGVYSLPSGNPVVTGTTIASTWANTTMADIATAMTDSLDRSGFGGMLASLQLFSGTSGSPGLSWSVETNSGLYRAAAGDFRYSIAGTDQLKLTTGQLLVGGTTAPGFTAALGVMSAGSTNLSVHNTSGSIEALLAAGGTGGVVGSFTNHPFEIRTNNVQRINVGASGNVAINNPGSGVALTINSVSSGIAASIEYSTAASSGAYIRFVDTTNSITRGFMGSGNTLFTGATVADFGISSAGTGVLRLGYAGGSSTAVQISSSGNVTISTPGSGVTTTFNGIANNNIVTVTDGTVVGQWGTITASAGYLGTSSNHGFQLETNNTSRISIAAGGSVTINVPTSGIGLTVSGVANSNVAQFTGNSTSGQSFGPAILAGTTSADYGLSVRNQPGTSTYFLVRGDGVIFGNDGTSQFELGYKDAPQNIQNAGYTLVLADRGKHVYMNTAGTYTIPANASVAFPTGTVIIFYNSTAGNCSIAITTDTLLLAGTATTGTRTLASGGLATIMKTSSTGWVISGAGVT